MKTTNNKNSVSTFIALLLLACFKLTYGQAVYQPTIDNGADPQATVACGIDTVEYAMTKSTGEDQVALYKGNIEGLAQWYELPANANLHGVSFRAGMVSANGLNTTGNITVGIYNSTVDSLPQAVPIVVTTISVDTNYKTYTAPLLASVPVTTDYIVTVEYGSGIAENDTVLVGVNLQGDGNNEHLGAGRLNSGGTTVWLDFDNVLPSPDRDALIFPWIEYDLTADFSMPGDTVCVDEMLDFINQSTAFAGHRMYNRRIADPATFGDAFAWDFGGGASSNLESPMHMYNSTGSQTILLTTAITGYHTSCTEPAVKGLEVSSRPIADFMVNQQMASQGDTLMFTNLSTGGISCSWDFGDSTFATGCTDQMHIYDTAGTFIVTLTVISPYGCEEIKMDTISILGPLAIESRDPRQSLKFYPNPARNQVTVAAFGTPNEESSVKILDLQGRTVRQKEIRGGMENRIELTGIASGLYLLQVRSGKHSETGKIIINNE